MVAGHLNRATIARVDAIGIWALRNMSNQGTNRAKLHAERLRIKGRDPRVERPPHKMTFQAASIVFYSLQMAAISVTHDDGLVSKDAVEDPDDPRIQAMVAMVGHRHRLAEAFGFIIDAARADRIDIPPIRFRLRVDQRVAIHF